MAQMPRASVDKFTWNPAVPCTAAPLVSAGAMPKRPVAFREAASSQGQSPSCEGRYGEPAWCRGTTLADECHGYEGHPPSGANVPLRRPTEPAGGSRRRRGSPSAIGRE